MIEKAEQELGARNRNDSLQVLFEQAKRIEAPSFIPGDNVNLRPGNERTMNLFKKGHLGGPLQKSVSSPILNDISQVPKKIETKAKGPKGKNPWRFRAEVPIKDVSAYSKSNSILIKEDGPRWKEYKRTDIDANAGSPISWQATDQHQKQMHGSNNGYSRMYNKMLRGKHHSSSNILQKSGSTVLANNSYVMHADKAI